MHYALIINHYELCIAHCALCIMNYELKKQLSNSL